MAHGTASHRCQTAIYSYGLRSYGLYSYGLYRCQVATKHRDSCTSSSAGSRRFSTSKVRVCVHACACVCVRACVRARVRVCTRALRVSECRCWHTCMFTRVHCLSLWHAQPARWSARSLCDSAIACNVATCAIWPHVQHSCMSKGPNLGCVNSERRGFEWRCPIRNQTSAGWHRARLNACSCQHYFKSKQQVRTLQ